MRPSSESSSPLLPLVEVSRSPLLPSGDSLWDQMDQISPPSSPSPNGVPDSTMDLDRWASRGFSEDSALLPRQIEKPFRFLDLPAEIRNIIYEFAFGESACNNRPLCQYYLWGPNGSDTHDYVPCMKCQWYPPCLSSVNKQLRQETLPIYYAMHDFDWAWDPENISREVNLGMKDSVEFVKRALKFLERHNLWMRSILLYKPFFFGQGGRSLKPLVESVYCFAQIQHYLNETDRSHRVLGKMRFYGQGPMSQDIFNFAGTLEHEVLGNKRWVDEDLRAFLRADKAGSLYLKEIEDCEFEDLQMRMDVRAVRKVRRREENIAKGGERWSGVLRGRPAEVKK